MIDYLPGGYELVACCIGYFFGAYFEHRRWRKRYPHLESPRKYRVD